jgi:hypothetical protein
MRIGLFTTLAAASILTLFVANARAQTPSDAACAPCIRAAMETLAGDAMRGRGSGTPDELAAATFIGSELQRHGIAPAGDNGTYLQTADIIINKQRQRTWNAVGILRGSDPVLAQQVLLLSAHLDHLGVGPPVDGDAIYNGADDDASGTTAVLEMARVLGGGLPPKRTVIFALFGSEEKGGLGSNWFLAHLPMPLTNIVANLEFEMIGRPDPAVRSGKLWLTGWDRSNLGPTLAQHGASLVGDPHPEQNFFERSDNILLARRGVVAQTVSSFGLHPQYHRPSDDLAHIDWTHMETAIGSMVAPIQWLVNADFQPEWLPGRQP